MKLVVVDCGSGNLRSVSKAFEKAGLDAGLSPFTVSVTTDPEEVLNADRIVLPGQGAFADCRKGIDTVPGMLDALTEAVRHKGRPFFGICVGMQLLATEGLEHGHHKGFDWIPGRSIKIEIPEAAKHAPEDAPALKIPHMGWDRFEPTRAHPLFSGLEKGEYVYFCHSYHVVPDTRTDVLANVEYGLEQACVLGRDTIVATQFHPEKSQAVGLRLIENFLKWAP